MAYAAAGLNLISEAGYARHLWSYLTPDPAATVDTTGYFNDASEMLRIGDIILRVTVDNLPLAPGQTPIGAVPSWGIHVVASNSGGVVDTFDALVGSVVDTD